MVKKYYKDYIWECTRPGAWHCVSKHTGLDFAAISKQGKRFWFIDCHTHTTEKQKDGNWYTWAWASEKKTLKEAMHAVSEMVTYEHRGHKNGRRSSCWPRRKQSHE